jgi:hypothetical protein
MAGGRDLRKRSPRWLDWFAYSSGLTSAACFIWRVVLCDGEAECPPISPGMMVPRLLGFAILPLLLVVTLLGRTARRLTE